MFNVYIFMFTSSFVMIPITDYTTSLNSYNLYQLYNLSISQVSYFNDVMLFLLFSTLFNSSAEIVKKYFRGKAILQKLSPWNGLIFNEYSLSQILSCTSFYLEYLQRVFCWRIPREEWPSSSPSPPRRKWIPGITGICAQFFHHLSM